MNIIVISPGIPSKFRPHFMPFISEQVIALSSRAPINIFVFVCFPLLHYINSRYIKKYIKFQFEKPLPIESTNLQVIPIWFLSRPRKILGFDIINYQITNSILKKVDHIGINADIIHGHFGIMGQISKIIADKLNVSYILTEHSSDLLPVVKQLGKKELIDAYHSAKKVICVSESLERKVKNFDKEVLNTLVIPNGIDTRKFRIRKKKENKKKICFIGHLIDRKGIKVLMDTCLLLKKDGFQFELNIYGTGNLKSYILDFTKKYFLQNSIFLKGVVPNEMINGILLENDLFVLPSYKESFGVVIIEALASGLPVISTNCGGPETIIKDSLLGEIIEPGNPEVLKNTIIKVFNNYSKFDPQHLHNYTKINYDWDGIVNKIIDIYKK